MPSPSGCWSAKVRSMLVGVVAAVLLAQSPVQLPPDAAPGENWVVVAVGRVIAPDQHPGMCFVQGRIEQVVQGDAWRVGQSIGLTLACRAGLEQTIALQPAPEPPTIRLLKSRKRALVRVDEGGRVLRNAYYGLDPAV